MSVFVLTVAAGRVDHRGKNRPARARAAAVERRPVGDKLLARD